jgi:hypothetical protein
MYCHSEFHADKPNHHGGRKLQQKIYSANFAFNEPAGRTPFKPHASINMKSAVPRRTTVQTRKPVAIEFRKFAETPLPAANFPTARLST